MLASEITLTVERFAVSLDNKLLILSVKSKLILMNYETNDIIDEMCYSSDCQLYMIKWINEKTVAIVSNQGLLLFDVDNRKDMYVITTLEQTVNPSHVVGVFVDLENKYYLMQITDKSIGRMQIGKFYSTPHLLDGMSGCLCEINTPFRRDRIAALFYRRKKQQSSFHLKVFSLEEQEKPMYSHSIEVQDIGHNNRPEYIIPDQDRGLAYLIYRNGFVHIWDLLNCSLLYSSLLCNTPLLSYSQCSQEGFVSVWKGESRVLQIRLEGSILVQHCLKSINQSINHSSLHLAVRCGLVKSINQSFLTLLHVVFCRSVNRLPHVIQSFIQQSSVVRSSQSVNQWMKKDNACELMMSHLINAWRLDEITDWETVIQQFFEGSNGMMSTEDRSTNHHQLHNEEKLDRFRSSVILTSTLHSPTQTYLQSINPLTDPNYHKKLTSIITTLQLLPNENRSNQQYLLTLLLSTLFTHIDIRIQAMKTITRQLSIPEIENHLIEVGMTVTKMKPEKVGLEQIIDRLKKNQLQLGSLELKKLMIELYPDMYERSKMMVKLRKLLASIVS